MPTCENTEALLGEARRLHAAGQLGPALVAYRRVLAAAPEHAVALNLCGVLRYQLGDHDDAVALLSDALRRAPEMAGAWQNLVLPLLALGRTLDACAAGARAVAAAPEVAAGHHNLALALSRAGRSDEAAVAAETALALAPEAAGAWALLAGIRAGERRYQNAAALYRRALSCNPGDVAARFGLALALQHGGDPAAAEAAYRNVLEADPDHLGAHVNLGVVLRDRGRWEDARAVWARGLAVAPQSEELRFNLACARLRQGAWREGWEGYEARWAARGQKRPSAITGLPAWDGTPLPGGTLLVHHEQGLGDTIQFVRLLPLARERVGTIVFVCQPSLVRLLSRCPWFRPGPGGAPPPARIIADGEPLPDCASSVALLSLPRVLGITPENLPRSAPYLEAEPDRARQWATRLAAMEPATAVSAGVTARGACDGASAHSARRLRIGLQWQGNPEAPGDPGRSLPLAAFAPLAGIDGVRLFALQKDFGREQLATAPPALGALTDLAEHLDAEGDAFVDTAAALAALDLLITSDTAVAHLAGALGRPVWLLLKAGADWRWGSETALSPWYPTMRLFRQREPGDWAAVMAEVAAALTALMAARRAFASASPPAITVEAAAAAHEAGRFAEAAAAWRSHLCADPDQPDILNRLAIATCEAAAWAPAAIEAALVLALRAASLAPAAAEIHSNLGVLLKRLGRCDDAEIAMRHALAAAPAQPGALQNLVNLLKGRGRTDEALAIAERAAAVAPDVPAVLAVLGDVLAAAGRPADAERAYRRALAGGQAEPQHWVALGTILSAAGRWDAAVECWERALELDPEHVNAFNNLGVAERGKGDVNLACWFHRRALAANPRQPASWCNYGIALLDRGEAAAACAAFANAISLDPEYADAHMALGMALLLEGNFADGLPAYEWRLRSRAFGSAPPRLPMPAWDGGDVAGRRLLLLAEQGFGDAIMFVRYARVLKARGAAAVFVGCRPRLARLLATADGVDAVIAEGAPVPRADAYVHLMSVPHRLGTRLETIPAEAPYLAAEPERVLHWAGRLVSGSGFRVGLVWQGSTDPRVDRGRSLPLAAFAPLAGIPGVRLIALQKGPGSEQRAALAETFPVESLGEDFDGGDDAFVDSAAVMMNLDLIITSDTAIAHLAGALGRPCWVLLKATPEWRWLRDRDDSPWYPSLRLFRQPAADPGERGDADPWEPVIASVCRELARLVAGDRSALLPAGPRAAATFAAATAEPPARACGGSAGPVDARRLVQEAQAMHQQGDVAGAARLYARALACEPDHASALDGAGVAALQLGRHRRAALLLGQARRAGRCTPELLSNLALALKGSGDLAGAEQLLRDAIAGAPAFGEARLNLGNLLRESGRPGEAVAVLRDALPRLCGPAHQRCLRGLGNALRDTGALRPAIEMLERAVAAAPEDAEAHIDLAHALLTRGDYRRGFREYEWRWRGRELRAPAAVGPAWDGRALDGRTLLVRGEQGLGDQIQFARFLGAAAARVGSMVFACRAALVRLLQGLTPLPENCRIVAEGAPEPPHDAQIALLSLPHLLGTRLETLPAVVPYLRAEPERLQRWSGCLAGPERLRVGLAWQGNPHARADRGRSLPPMLLEPVLAVPGVRFVALQKEHGLDGLAALAARYPLVRPGDGFDAGDDAFLDTAAIMAGLDLVITTDTAIAHLAGALGRPCWVLLQAAADWRWLSGRHDSPWYPSMRLFRQPAPGDWAAVLSGVAGALAAHASAAAAR